jgi:hypothetical protein
VTIPRYWNEWNTEAYHGREYEEFWNMDIWTSLWFFRTWYIPITKQPWNAQTCIDFASTPYYVEMESILDRIEEWLCPGDSPFMGRKVPLFTHINPDFHDPSSNVAHSVKIQTA